MKIHKAPDGSGGARGGNHSAPMPRRRNGRTKRRSTRSFGEYAFLEDSRYASQMKNISG
jgi:hypothetical protein